MARLPRLVAVEMTAPDAARAEAALRRLIERMDAVHADPAYVWVWQCAQLHGMPYAGPTYTEELNAARAALAPRPVQAACVSAGDGSCHTHPGGWMIACDAAAERDEERGCLTVLLEEAHDKWETALNEVTRLRAALTHADGLAEALEAITTAVFTVISADEYHAAFERGAAALTAYRAARGGGG